MKETMKPSERIHQILEEKWGQSENKILYLPVAIEIYLDEQYEAEEVFKTKVVNKQNETIL